jgi:phosphate transport system substrate-binding protein
MRRASRSPGQDEGFEGAVAGLGLSDIIQLNGHNRFSGCVTVQSDSFGGVIFFRDGQIIHAEAGDEVGEKAFYEIMQWTGGKFTLQPNVTTTVRSIERNWEFLLMEACRLIDEGRRGLPNRPPAGNASHPPGWDKRTGVAARMGTKSTSTRTLVLVGAAVAAVAVAGAGLYLWRANQTITRGAASKGPAASSTAASDGKAATVTTPSSAPKQVLLRVGGASALASQLGPTLAKAYLASLQATDIQTNPTSENDIVVQATHDGGTRWITVSTHGSATGLEELLDGTADVAISLRRIKPEERQRLAPLGAMTSQANEHVLALDGLAVIVNMANSVSHLKRSQLAAIFGGAISDWSMVGLTSDVQSEWSAVGVGGKKGGPLATGVHAYAPDDKVGVAEVFQSAVLGNVPFSTEVKRLPTLEAVTDAVIGDPGGIGFVPLSFVLGGRAVPVADADETPLLPTAFTVATEEYLLTQRVYLYTAQSSDNPHVAKFVQFALGLPGQAVVKKAGLIELAVKAEQRNVPTGAPADYVKLIGKSRRLSSTFRFEENSTTFDNRAQRDLDRVVAYLRDNDLSGSDVKVLGFSDAPGSKARNLKLSQERATLVAQALAQRGIAGVTVAAPGPVLPVADNATERGRQRNRRVEIWVTAR